MKKIIVLCCFFALFSCRSVKVADRVDVQVRDKSKVDVVETHAEQTRIESAATVTTSESISVVEEVVEVTYDTDKPVDPVTGRPPVQREVTKKKTVEKGGSSVSGSSQSQLAVSADSVVDRTQKDIDVDIDVEHEETPQKSSFAYIYYIVLIVAIGVGAWFLNKKFGFIAKLFKL